MQKKFGASVNEFAASEAANWVGSQESRGSSEKSDKNPLYCPLVVGD